MVKETLESIKYAEETTGEKFPDESSPAEVKALKPTPNQIMADSEDEEDYIGDSALETRRSIQYAENQLKERWFINE